MPVVSRPDAILIAGPTASGKSQLALDLADRWNGAVVNADSMQVYPVLRVLTARPDDADEAVLPHHLYGHADLRKPYSVAQWLADVRPALTRVQESGRIPVIVGGTGLYFQTLERGLAEVPDIPRSVRDDVRQSLINDGSVQLYERLQQHDPTGAASLRASDGQRIARALEVVLATGRPLSAFTAQQKVTSLLEGMQVDRIILEPERSVLHERINLRAGQMIDAGAESEVRDLLALNLPPDATVLKAIGVSQLASCFCGEFSLNHAVEKIKTLTRQYAKRQSTWFRGQFDSRWRRILS